LRQPRALVAVNETASSTASSPKSVVNLMTGFMATDDVSLKGIANRVADDRGVVQRRAFLFEFHFDDLLSVIPRGAGVGMKIAW